MGVAVDLRLPENLTISSAHGLHEEIEGLFDKHEHDKVVIHAEDVHRADTAGIQLLLAFVNSAKDHQIELTWNSPSEPLVSAAKVLGLNEVLGIH